MRTFLLRFSLLLGLLMALSSSAWAAFTSFTPTSGSVGNTVTIQGSGFTTATVVTFNGTRATIASVANNGKSLTVTVPVGATTGNVLVDGATASGRNATLVFTVTLTADVSVALTAPTPNSFANSVRTGNFTVTFANNGPDAAPSVTRTVTLPTGASSVTTSAGTVSGTTIDFGTLTNQASGTSSTFTFSFVTPAAPATSMTTTAQTTVTGATDPNTAVGGPNPNSVSVNSSLGAATADVSTTITGPASGTAPAGGFVTYYTITTTNTSTTTTATNVAIRVDLAPATGFTEISASNQGTYSNGVVTYPTVASLAPGQTITRLLQVRIPVTGISLVTAKASSTSDTDANLANNNGTAATANVSTNVTQEADIAVTVNGPGQALPGKTVTYNVLVTNNGPSNATGVTAQLTFTSATKPATLTVNGTAPTSYSAASGVLTFSIPSGGALATGTSVAYTVRYTAPSAGTTVAATVKTISATTSTDLYLNNNNGTRTESQVTTAVSAVLPQNTCALPAARVDFTFDGATSINTYYPATASATAGASSLTVDVANFVPTTGTTIKAGDLIMIMQMQGATIDFTNTDAYGDGVAGEAGSGQTSSIAGQYEYAIVASTYATGSGTVPLSSPLINSYVNAAASATDGQKRFQVVRVPQYQSLTLNADVTNVEGWNGTAGGLLVLDIAGALNLNGHTINLKGLGFRGGAGRQLLGDGAATTLLGSEYRTLASVNVNGAKGEGIAGTPRFVNDSGVLVDNTTEGYPSGSQGRGAPGNAGGGGTDSNAKANDENTGGGGGSNAGTGGRGGDAWNSARAYGGAGGSPFLQAAPSRVIMGGGGGAGTTNNGTGNPTQGFASSGSAGGGIALVRASTVNGTGTIDVSGDDVTYQPLNDGSGGGGAGGSVVLITNNSLSNVTILANGGKGGTNTGNGQPHGPGGGGSGGVAFTSSPISNPNTAFVGGASGLSFGNIPYGSTAGTTSTPPARTDVTSSETPLLEAQANCVADVTTAITGPAVIQSGGVSGTFTATFTNNGPADASTLIRSITLPVGATMTAAQVTASGGTYTASTLPLLTGGTLSYPTLTGVASGFVSTVTFTLTAPTVLLTTAASITSNTNSSTQGTNQGSDVGVNTFTLPVTFKTNAAPTATNVTNVTIANNGGATVLNSKANPGTSLAGTDPDGTVASFTIASLPSSGTLTYNGVVLTNANIGTTSIPNTPASLALLTYTPVVGSTSTGITFTYKAVDNDGNASAAATYTIPVGSAPVANDDDVTTPLNTAITFAVTANDQPSGSIAAATIDLDPNTTGIQTSFTTAEGVFTTVGVTAGSVKFTPNTGFLGVANTPYTVQNTDGATTNQANLIVRVESQLDLATTISAPATVVAGAQLTITGTTVNKSLAGTTANAVQSIQLPPGLTGTIIVNGVSQTISAATTATGLFTFGTLNGFAAGSTANYSLTFTAPLNGPFTVTAIVAPIAGDIDLTNNTASAPVNVTPQTDVFTTITGPTTNPVAGALLTYAVTTGDVAGSTPATGLVQTVQVPSGITGVFATNGGVYSATAGTVTFNGVSYAVAANTVTFPPVSLAAGQVVNNSISFSAPAAGTVLNAVTATVPTTNDAVQANNTATAASLTVQPASTDPTKFANLYVIIGNGTLQADGTFSGPVQVTPDASNNYTATYTVKQGNNGPAAADNVQTVVMLPAGLNPADITVDGTAATTSNYNATTGRLTLPALSGTAAQLSTASQTYTIVVKGPATVAAITATASVTTTSTDPVAANNMATTQTEIVSLADVAITLNLREGTGNVAAGQRLTYFVQTQNNSANPAQGVQQTVAIVPGLSAADLQLNGATGTLVNGTITFGTGATYTVASGLLTLPVINSLFKGVLVDNTISFSAPAYGAVRVVAAVNTLSRDAVLTNNSATISNGINQAVDLAVSLAGPATVVVGNPVLYTVTTTNNGPSVTGTQLTSVQLPTGLTGVEVRDNSGTVLVNSTSTGYNAATGVVTFAATTVSNVGQSTQGTISFVAPNVPQLDVAAAVALNVAAGSTNPYEANLDNNSARVNTATVVSALASADLATTFTLNPTTAQVPGATVSYTVQTTNATGGATAQNPVQLVNLPVGLTATGLKVNNTTGTLSNGVITFGTGATASSYNVSTGLLTILSGTTLAAGAAVNNTISFPMPAADILLTAASSSDNPDLVPANNANRVTTLTSAQADVVLSMSGPAYTAAGTTVTYSVVATNSGPSTAANVTTTFTLPLNVTTYSVNGGAATTVAAGSTVTLPSSFQSVPAGGALSYLVSFAAPTATTFTAKADVTTTSAGNLTSNDHAEVTTGENIAPVANDIVNAIQSPEGNTAVEKLPITGLSATDADGSIASYSLVSFPDPATVGTLYVNGSAVTSLRSLTTTQANQLTFTPKAGFVGSVSFTYTATDNGNGPSNVINAQSLTSNVARYTIQVGSDNVSAYNATVAKGGTTANAYQTNDVLAFVIDPNGAKYTNGGATAPGVVYNTADVKNAAGVVTLKAGTLVDANVANGLRTTTTTNAYLDAAGPASNPTNGLPTGVSLNPATGQIFVSNASLLPAITAAATYSVYVITTDVNGGVSRVLATFTLGAYPLPVELAAFTAKAVRNTDAVLDWTTASEKNNDHFVIERSFDGHSFTKIGQVAGQGSKSSPTAYTLTDKGIGARAAGSIYYRLQQVDLDGVSSYSPVRTVSFTAAAPVAITAANLSLYPVPATTSTTLDLTILPGTRTYSVRLTDLSGRSVSSYSLAGGQQHRLDLTGLASGSYLVQVSGTDAQGTPLRVVKRLTKE